MDIFGFRLYFQSLIGVNFLGISLIVLCFALLILCALALFGPQRFPFRSSQPTILKILRLTALGVFFFFVILEPVFVRVSRENLKGRKPSLALLMDFTRSMSVTGRVEDSIEWFDRRIKYLDENFDLRIFAFGVNPSTYYEDYVKEFKSKEEAEKFFNNIKNKSSRRAGGTTRISDGANNTDIPFALSQIVRKYDSGGKDVVVKGAKNFDSRRLVPDGILLVSDGVNTQSDGVEKFSPAERVGKGVTQADKDNEMRADSQYRPFVFVADVFKGKHRKPPDISIISSDAPAYAFKGMKIPISLKIKKTGASGEVMSNTLTKVVIKVRSSDKPTKNSKSTAIDKSTDNPPDSATEIAVLEKEIPDGVSEVKFDIPPVDRTGLVSYTASVSTFSWEVTGENNRTDFSIEILRDKIRVLYLCGRPSYEYSFLRDFLKNDLGFELVTFVILRNPEDVVLVPDEELSLIPFPGADLIVRQLKDFDVVIFENFTYNRFGIYPQHLEMIKKWVENGGGFLMIAGENSFGNGGYSGTAISQILPVIIESDEREKRFASGRFNPVIARQQAGEEDGFTDQWFSLINQISDSGALKGGHHRNQDRWGEIFNQSPSAGYQLPPIEGIEILKPRDRALVKIAHPWLKIDRNIPTPVLALMDYGKGRTGALLANSTWRWKINPQSPSGLYEGFWKAVINYLAYSSGEDAGKIRVIGFKSKVGKDEVFNFVVKKRYPSSRLSVVVTHPDGSKKLLEPLSAAGQPAQGVLYGKKSLRVGDNYVMFSLIPDTSVTGGASDFSLTEGRYIFEITDESPTAGKDIPRIKKETLVMVVSAENDYIDDSSNRANREMTYLDVDEDYLKLISAGLGGIYFKDDLSSLESDGVFVVSCENMKKLLLRQQAHRQTSKFYKNEGSQVYPTPDGEEKAQIKEIEKGYIVKWVWRSSKDLWFIVLIVAALIIAELVLRRKRYGLW